MAELDSANVRLIREEVGDLLTEMESALLELEIQPENASLVNRVFRAMHTIKGAAEMFGLTAISSLTHEVESVYDAVRNKRLAVSQPLLDVSFRVKDIITRLVGDFSAEPDQEYNDVLQGMRDICTAGQGDVCSPGAEPPARESYTEPEAELNSYLEDSPVQQEVDRQEVDRQEVDQQETGQQEHKVFGVLFAPKGPGVLASMDPLGVLDELRELGEATVAPLYNAAVDLVSLEPEDCVLSWAVVLRTVHDQNAVRDVFIFVEGQSGISIEELEDPDAWLEAQKEKAGAAAPVAVTAATPVPASAPAPEPEPPQQPSKPAPQPTSAPKAAASLQPAKPVSPPQQSAPKAEAVQKKTPAKPAKTEVSSIRVDAYKLDDLVALVGELVIAQAKLNQAASRIAEPTLTAVAEEIDLLAGNLRDRTLSMRMLPIGATFDRFRRLVRDLSHELGKEINLVTHGAETELDKTVIEQLGDPLVHLLRNSIDHGLETPAEREDAGKEREGTLLLSAEHSGGNVLIKIVDDGKGIDREKILAKARERGLAADESAMSDSDVFNLIFQPGFSTAEQVTNVSGRGVGMDVVKRSIEGLRGSVSIESELGKGTTVTVKLPLTLAIIEGLQVRAGEEYFVLPLSTVEECVELSPEDNANGEGRKKIINLRNEIVPYIRLREWFEIDGVKPDIEQVIVTGGTDNLRTGIVVDEVIGQQQTVIKSLGRVFEQVQEISGATIKGDGSMALILDVPYLVRKVRQDADKSSFR